MGGKSNKRKAALYENSNTLLKIIWKKEKFSLRKIWFWTFVEYCVPYWVMSITSGHLRIAMPPSSSSPSTSSQQLVWSCSPFFTNSMISQLQVPAVIVIVSIILMLTFVLPKITIISLQYLHHRVHMFWRRAPVSPPCPPCWSARPRGSWTQSRFSTTCAFCQTLLCLKVIFNVKT